MVVFYFSGIMICSSLLNYLQTFAKRSWPVHEAEVDTVLNSLVSCHNGKCVNQKQNLASYDLLIWKGTDIQQDTCHSAVQ